ncbi:nuclear transport factor 2 family protein [Actinoplanes friuliensis]|uniref:SnoaL-like domain-containing protein n=1 Tax=Actinoplanes friuliensis DSM 7358 TaxID=1246995 RepID=U5VUW2_9ACTN|nr:nuclear transport factor 2 family protein [Actinoplanes friuliensis]AGZ40572.1 hypothetical protein AFR_11415 [Actinoplanes friuliensis DSM 7358]
MSLSHHQIFERYVYAGAILRDAGAVAALFTEDGVFEAPLVPAGHRLPRRLVGRAAIEEGLAVYHRDMTYPGVVDTERSTYVLHATTDPDVFVAEIDTVFETPAGQHTTMSLAQIFRLRAGHIAVLRDYFAPPTA